MHDHNILNYNKKFHYENIECCQHLERDLQKNSDDTKHIWSTEIKKLTGKAIKDRNERMAQGETAFSREYIRDFYQKLDGLKTKKVYRIPLQMMKEGCSGGWQSTVGTISGGWRISACRQQIIFQKERCGA